MSSKLKRINKLKLITFWVICGLIALFFKFSIITPTYAYYLGEDYNIYSDNLIDNDDVYSTGSIDINTTDTGFDIINHLNLNWGQYATFSINYLDSGTYTLSFDQNPTTLVYVFVDDVQIFGDGQTVLNHMTINIPINRNGANLNIRFYTNSSITNLMLNKGSTELSYEPSGKWWNENAYETQKYLASLININELFNGATVELDGTGDGVLASGIMSLDNNSDVILSYSDLPYVIRNYITTHSNEDFEINIKLTHQTNASLYLNSNYNTISCSVYHDYNGGFPLNDNYYRKFNASLNTNNYLINPNFNYNYLSISYINTSNNSFNISISNDNYFYRDGYNDGYNIGYSDGTGDGYNNGYSVGKIDGYNNGYTEGEQTDFASSGFKTLITTILSYPVNMVKESLNFEFMGIHIASIVLFLISLGIVAFVIKRFKD